MITKLLFMMFFCATSFAQITLVPDTVFEQVLINKGIDSDGEINGQLLTADALALTELVIASPSYDEWIYDLTGIEDFINLESLNVSFTMIEELNVSTLTNLKYLYCVDNMLTAIDVSNNTLLEYLDMSSGGDVLPFNSITEVDVSNNPAIKTLKAVNVYYVNLKNNNNTADFYLDVTAPMWGFGADYIDRNVCIEVDDAIAAQNGELPYSEWTVIHTYSTYSMVESCSLNVYDDKINTITIYPNPATDVVHFEIPNSNMITNIQLFDVMGRLVKEYYDVHASISVEGMEAATYVLRIFSGNTVQTQKLVIK